MKLEFKAETGSLETAPSTSESAERGAWSDKGKASAPLFLSSPIAGMRQPDPYRPSSPALQRTPTLRILQR